MVAGELADPIDVLVVGGGPGGYAAAARAAELGRQVVLVEQGRLGGVCLNVGCIPSKALTTVGHDMARAREGAAHGIHADVRLDFAAVQQWKQETVDKLVSGVGQILSKVRVVQGTAFFLSDNRVSVEHDDQVSYFQYQQVIVATGSEPIALPDLPFDHERIVDSTGALAFPEVPHTLAVVGGGYIGTELGMAYARLGSKVTIVEATDRILAGFDRDLAKIVHERARELGIEVLTLTSAKAIDGGDLIVVGEDGQVRVPAEKVLVAVGRRPRTRDLQLEDLGVAITPSGHVIVDQQCRTTVSNVFAIGDVTEGPALAHRASAQGRVAAEVITGLPSAFDALVPLIAFTDPEVASVGLGEDEAKARGQKVVVGRSRFAASGRAAILGESAGLVKVVVDPESEQILGVHIAGPSASDLIGEGTLAVETACRAEDLAGTIHPHPTLIESIHEAAVAARRRLER